MESARATGYDKQMPQPSAIITGAGRGIGRATAVQLALDGFRLALVARSADELGHAAELCQGAAISIPADVSDPAAVEGVVERVLSQFGRVDALVHNAGLALLKPIDRFSLDEWRSTLDTNLSAAFYFVRLLWPVWLKQQSGTLVMVSSEAARDPLVGFAAYGAAKAAVNNFGLSLAREGASIGLRVHVVAPGAVETTMLRSVISEELYPTEKTLAPEDVAAVIAQCVRGDLRHTSGEVIYVHKTL
jgi:NAD(P)-dependent dehydrogenase (short-subunit alcohol dehydrogenase family)